MENLKYKIPVQTVIYFKTGKSKTIYMEASEEQYREYLRPLAKILADEFTQNYTSQK